MPAAVARRAHTTSAELWVSGRPSGQNLGEWQLSPICLGRKCIRLSDARLLLERKCSRQSITGFKDASASILLVVDIRSGLAIGSFDRVLQIAVGLLNLAFAFIDNSFVVKVGVTGNTGDRLFSLAFQFIDLAGNLFLFHARTLHKLDPFATELLLEHCNQRSGQIPEVGVAIPMQVTQSGQPRRYSVQKYREMRPVSVKATFVVLLRFGGGRSR